MLARRYALHAACGRGRGVWGGDGVRGRRTADGGRRAGSEGALAARPSSAVRTAAPFPGMRILAIKLATVGDVLLTTPALRALKESLGAEITLLTPPQSAGVLEGTGLVDHFLAFDKYRFDSALGSLRPGR